MQSHITSRVAFAGTGTLSVPLKVPERIGRGRKRKCVRGCVRLKVRVREGGKGR